MQPKQGAPKPGDSRAVTDILKFVVAVAFAVLGVFTYYWFDGQWQSWLRILAVVGGLVLGALVFLTSSKGPKLREFLVESRFELRKVVWPKRQEAMRMTWIVILVVSVFSVLLASFDWVIGRSVKLLLGT
nr:preprotein translocase subunit SecE [Lysobacter silvestris]